MTKETLARLPEVFKRNIESYKTSYRKGYKEDKERAYGYINALRDAEIISEVERRALIAYITV